MVLQVDQVTKSFAEGERRIPVLQGVSFDLGAGKTLALTGESGSGKSTLLHIIGGLEEPDSGSVMLKGQNLARMDDAGRAALRRQDVALVFQQFNLIPSLNVAANIAFQARVAGRHDAAFQTELTQALGLAEQVHKYPEALSGGQQQRVAIARALAVRPALLLADEPTGNLDEATASDVLAQMLHLVAQTGAAMLVVTHSPQVAARMDETRHLQRGILQ
ncbi:MAG: ABC transporter ATP-binding protein [Pseudomonadota bacterium]